MMEDDEALELAAKIVDDLARPTFVFRMARGMLAQGRFVRAGDRKRAVKAARQIIDVINDHAFHPTAG